MYLSKYILKSLLVGKILSFPAAWNNNQFLYYSPIPKPPTSIWSEIVLKPIEQNDLESINNLFYISKKHWGYSEEILKNFFDKYMLSVNDIQTPAYALWTESGDPIGFMSTLKTNNDFWLDNLFVHPSYMGRGVGSYLFQKAVEIADHSGYDSLKLMADPHTNIFYKKMGCTQVDTVDSSYAPSMKQNIYEFKIYN